MASVASSKQMTHHPNFSKTMELRWAKRPTNTRKPRKLQFPPSTGPSSVPIYISTRPGHVDPGALRDLYASCDLSCHRLPDVGHDRRAREDGAVGLGKLRIALAHSSVVVSVFCRDEDLSPDAEQSAAVGIGGLVSKMLPRVDPSDGRLVGFGRAVSDLGLTASIYDVMVIPSFRGMGIGRMIVKRIVRILTSRDIYDIAALCSENERPLFEACGFGDDILGSTTMMYTRTLSDGHGVVKPAGRNLLLVPTPKDHAAS
ncbi:probable acetyltransferase TAP2 [Syzygium oleosum]|uniref:probable acetyltransferase TAP2 n=1 Tax=Syzygium oleosum TaxID=219896 RepID=UPI0011D212CA|nr:probable acetyltransferase TAP2 [Syzygium oleosum]